MMSPNVAIARQDDWLADAIALMLRAGSHDWSPWQTTTNAPLGAIVRSDLLAGLLQPRVTG